MVLTDQKTAIDALRIQIRGLGSKEEEGKLEQLKGFLASLKDLERNHTILEKLASEATIFILKRYLLDPRSQIRQVAVSVLRYLLYDRQVTVAMKKYQIPLLVARCLEREVKDDKLQAIRNEQSQCLEFIRKWIKVDGENLPKLLANSLVAFTDQPTELEGGRPCIEAKQKLRAIKTIKKLAQKNVEMAAWAGGIRLLMESITNPLLEQDNESQQLVSYLLTILNDPKSRAQVGCYLDFPILFSIFSDIDSEPVPKDSIKHTKQLALARRAILVILKSWHGIIYLGDQRTCLVSLLESLRQQIKKATRDAIFEILQQLLGLAKKLSDGTTGNSFVQGLLKCYLVVLVQLLLDCNIFKILVELSGLEDMEKSAPSQRFLKQLTTIMFNTIPNSGKYTDFLISAASQKGGSLEILKSCTTSVVNTMGNYIFDSEKRGKSLNRFILGVENLYLSCPTGVPCDRVHNDTIMKLRSCLVNVASDLKFQSLLKASNIMVEKEDNWSKWNFQALREILTVHSNRLQQNLKVAKRLIRFYLPSKRLFSALPFTEENFIFAKVGYELVRNLLRTDIGQEYLTSIIDNLDATNGLITDLNFILRHALKGSEEYSDLLSKTGFRSKMVSQLVAWVGVLTESESSTALLVRIKLFQTFKEMVYEDGRFDHILLVLIQSFDLSQCAGQCHMVLFEYILSRGSDALSAAGIEIIRLCLHSEYANFKGWAVHHLSLLLARPPLAPKVLQVLEQIFEEESSETDVLLEEFLKNFEVTDRLESRPTFLPSLLSHAVGYKYLEDQFWLDSYFNHCYKKSNYSFVLSLEREFSQLLTMKEEGSGTYRLDIGVPANPIWSYNFLFKMPWRMFYEVSVGERDFEPVESDWLGLQFVDGSWLNLHCRVTPFEFTEETRVAVWLMVGAVYLDNFCNRVESKFTVVFSAKDRKKARSPSKHGWRLVSEGERIVGVQLQMRVYEQVANRKLPTNSFRNLAMTEEGIEYIRRHQWVEVMMGDLNQENVMKKREALWTLGNIGSTKLGVQLLREKKAFEKILQMGEHEGTLSMRGTCMYIVNLFSLSHKGRSQLEKHGWLVHWNNNMGWICMPKDSSYLFKIPQLRSCLQGLWPLSPRFQNYRRLEAALKLDDLSRTLVSGFSVLCSDSTCKNGVKEINQFMETHPAASKSKQCFLAVMLLLIFFSFRPEMRKFTYNKFKHFFENQQAATLLESEDALCLYDV